MDFEALLRLTGDPAGLIAAVQAASAKMTGLDQDALKTRGFLKQLAATDVDIKITADGRPAIAVAIDTIAKLKGLTSRGITIPIRADTRDAAAALLSGLAGAALRRGQNPTPIFQAAQAVAAGLYDVPVPGAQVGGGGSVGGWTGFLMRLAGGGGRGGGGIFGGRGGLLGNLGWGKGAGVPFLPRMAGFGSILGMGGLGLEHFLTLGLGVGASMTGGALGGGLLGAGALGSLAAGGGSDLAVMTSTIADTKTLGTALTALQTAQLQYGKNSVQAAAATQNLNLQMALLGNTAGVKAELGLAKSAQALDGFWDRATSGARVGAAAIGQQVLQVGNVYVPLVAAAAQRNFALISTGLKPLFAWLKGPEGIAIFQNLENIFARDLPTAMDILNKSVQFILKTIDFAAGRSGGFLASVDAWITKWNSSSGFNLWESHMGTLIGLWHLWFDIGKMALEDIFGLFKETAGVGTAFAQQLLSGLTAFHQYLAGLQQGSQLNQLFRNHLAEVVAIMKLLFGIIPGFAQIYLAVAIPLTAAVTFMVDAFDKLIHIPLVGTFVVWGAAIGLLFNKMKALLILQTIIHLVQGATAAIQVLAGGGGILKAVGAFAQMMTAAGRAAAAVAASEAAQAAATVAADGTIATANAAAGASFGGVLLGGLSAVAGFVTATLIPALASAAVVLAPLAAIFGISMLVGAGKKNPLAAPGTAVNPSGGAANASAAIYADLTTQLPAGDRRGGKAGASAMALRGFNLQANIIASLTAQGLSAQQAQDAAAKIAKAYQNGAIHSASDITSIVSAYQDVNKSANVAAAAAAAQANFLKAGISSGPELNAAMALWTAGVMNSANDTNTFSQLWSSGITNVTELTAAMYQFNSGVGGTLPPTQANINEFAALWADNVRGTKALANGITALGNLQTNVGPLISDNMDAVNQAWALGDHSMSGITKMVQQMAVVMQTTGTLTTGEQQLFAQQWVSGNHNLKGLMAEIQAMQAVEVISGPLTGQSIQAFEYLWARGVHNGTKLMTDILTLQQVMADEGPLTAQQMTIVEKDLAKGVTSVSQIEGDLNAASNASKGLTPAILNGIQAIVKGTGAFAAAMARMFAPGAFPAHSKPGYYNAAGVWVPLSSAGGNDIPARAGGGGVAGLSWVGEGGKELAAFPLGAHVYPHDVSMSMAMAGGRGGQPIVMHNSFQVNGLTADDVLPAMDRKLQQWGTQLQRQLAAGRR